jgi:hypothetical protein
VSLAVLTYLSTRKDFADTNIYKNAFASAIKMRPNKVTDNVRNGFIKKNGFSLNADQGWFNDFSKSHLPLLMIDSMFNSEFRQVIRKNNVHHEDI